MPLIVNSVVEQKGGMQSILITGVTGFLGSNLVRFFSSFDHYKLYGHSRDIERARTQYRNYPIELVAECAASVLNEHGIHSVIHLAGIAHDLSNRYKEEDYFTVNFEHTTALYDAFRGSNASKFIFLSSIKAAIEESVQATTEDVEPAPFSAYGKSKLKAEQYIQRHTNSKDKRFYILRPCMVHGPGNKGNLNLLYKFVKTGLPYPLGAFQNQRSFLNIDNFNFIIDQLVSENIPGGIYHLADDGTLSTKTLIKVMSEALGKKQRIWNIPAPMIRLLFALYNKKMVAKLTEDMVVSNTKLIGSIGKSLPVSIEEGIRRTVQSFNSATV